MTRPSGPPPPAAPAPATAPSVESPGRIRPRKLIAVAVAAVLLAGIVGLVVAAAAADGDPPSADRLQQPLDIDSPAVVTDSDGESDEDTVAVVAAPPPPPPSPSGSSGDEPMGDDGVAAVPVDAIESPTDDEDLPPLGGSPVELPDGVAPPPAVSAVAASAIGDLGPETVDALIGWDVVDRDDDYASFTDGTAVIEVFAVAGPVSADAGAVLTAFLDDRLADAERVSVSDAAPQAAARPEFVSVAGAEYVAVATGQQGTRTMSGAVIAVIGPAGSAVVVTTSREGRASAAELAADTELLQAVLAHVDAT